MKNSTLMAGASGMKIVDTTNQISSVRYSYLLPREDTTFTNCTGFNSSGDSVDFKDIQNWDGTLLSTDTLIVPRGFRITAFKLATGSVQCF